MTWDIVVRFNNSQITKLRTLLTMIPRYDTSLPAAQTGWFSGDAGVTLPNETLSDSVLTPAYTYTTAFINPISTIPSETYGTSAGTTSTSCPPLVVKGGPTPSQGAIIAFGIICGLLLLFILLALLFFCAKGYRRKGPCEKIGLEVKAGGGYGHSGRHRSRRGDYDYSTYGGNDEDSHRLGPDIEGLSGVRGVRRHGGHRMARGGTQELRMPVNLDGGIRVGGDRSRNQIFDPHGPFAGSPIYFNSGPGPAAAGMQPAWIPGQPPQNETPTAAQQLRADVDSAGDPSEISSSNSGDPKGSHRSRRRRHSKTSTSQSRDQRPRV